MHLLWDPVLLLSERSSDQCKGPPWWEGKKEGGQEVGPGPTQHTKTDKN